MDAVVLLSGGVDSTTVLTLAVREHGREGVLALSVEYGQKHSVEIEHAANIADFLGCAHAIVALPPIFGGVGFTVIKGGPPQPHLTYKEIAAAEGPSPTVVPYRNGNLLSVAAAVAVTNEASWVYAGMHAEDARNWAYPDCTPEFLGAMANAIRVGTYDKIRLVTPLQWMLKKEVVALGLKLDAPYHLTLSCYDGKEPACGKCPTCVERLQAFTDNGVEDPIEYEERPNWQLLLGR